MNPQESLSDKIGKSSDKTLGKGTHFHSKVYLGHISFSDFMDIVLCLISLQPDWKEITKINSWDFYALIRDLWREKQKSIYKIFKVGTPWSPGPGPMGGTMSTAENWAALEAGFLMLDHLLEFFGQPKEMAELSRPSCGCWPKYRLGIEKMVFPKFRRKYHAKKLAMILSFGEEVIQKLRERLTGGK